MRPHPALLPVLASGLLLLTGCGTLTSAGEPVVPTPSAAGEEKDGIRVTGTGGCARPCATYTVTGPADGPVVTTVFFEFRAADGGVMDSVKETVPAVAPGATVSRTVTAAMVPPDSVVGGRVAIGTVRTVPAAEASASSGPCPPSGVRVYADKGDSAMGLRVVGLHLENCGTAPLSLDGYPEVQPLDEEHRALPAVRILKGGEAIASGTGAEGPARPFTLRPGARARAGLVWRNTTEAGEPVNAPYARVRWRSGAAPVMVVPELDLGTTGRLGVGPWKPAEGRAPAS
ncbi:DUF4232 domain-containing protein [Streptomyces termitum]|uniref:DUF4232 domain-containing protein n=1 Tax=Streptomyces termitum TaxID=67368 RepID=A0A918WD08_9ACTN|nr:DUF4232 domain-containing protein [Streptomyces termitum]GHB07581.1 hypothetical protein GCM10010305_58430 [Streptomyces termitum]